MEQENKDNQQQPQGEQAQSAEPKAEQPKGGKPKGERGEGGKAKGEKPEGGKAKGEKKGKSEGAPEGGKSKKEKAPPEPRIPPRLKEKYRNEVTPKLAAALGISNRLALPRIRHITVSVGMGKQLEGAKLNPKAKEQVLKDLAVITGQKPVMVRAKKSVSNFKLRAGYEIGAMVTMRGDRMWEFLDRLVALAIPRIKDFRGLSDTSFDKGGNYSFGIAEQGIFPEIDMANVEFMHGMHVTIGIGNSDPTKSALLLREMGWPFVKEEDRKTAGKAA